MPYRRLGPTGLKVSVLSFGSWVSFGAQLDTGMARDCLAAAREAGVNFFDNAEAYAGGESERIMGAAIAELGWARETYVVSSKFFWGLTEGVNTRNTLNRKYLMHAIDGSLERFGLDFLDVIFCHRPDPETPVEETVEAMSDIIESGRAHYWGVSEWSADEIRAAWDVADRRNLRKPVTEQPQYHLFERRKVEREYARLYEDIGLGLTTWSPLASGLLTGKYLDGVPSDSRAALEGLRVAQGLAHRRAPQRSGARAHGRGRAARRDRRAARDRVVRREPAGLHRDHRRVPSRAGRREHGRAPRARAADARAEGRDRGICRGSRHAGPHPRHCG